MVAIEQQGLTENPCPSSNRESTSTLLTAPARLRFNEHMDEADGPLVFAHACKLGLEGIVSKRKDSRYRSGRSPDWIKSKNPDAPAVKREGALKRQSPSDQQRT